MKILLKILVLALSALSPVLAQQSAPSSQLGPVAATRKVISPEILPDSRVIFRLDAPKAQQVELRANFPSGYQPSIIPMTQGEDGIWTVTVGPLAPEFRFYNFFVDGAPVVDPSNPHSRRDGVQVASTLLIPGPQSDLEALHDEAAHGTLAQIWYPSPVLKMQRRMYVYTPPGYEASHARYPVLYLLHGGGGDEDAWTSNGRAPIIFDNMIARNLIKPMIVVMPNGNSNQEASQDYVANPPDNVPGSVNMAFTESLVKEVIPFIDHTYRTRADAPDRAIAGLSMGGGQTWYTAFNHLDLFDYVGLFSASASRLPGVALTIPPPPATAELRAPGLTEGVNIPAFFAALPDLTPAANHKLRLFYITIGEHDGLTQQYHVITQELDQRNIHYVGKVVPGYIHEWAFWRVALEDMLPRLFLAKP